VRTRREQVQAYRFVTRRIVSAVLSGEPESNELPMRRLGMSLFGSVMVAAIVLAGFGVYGLISKNGAPLETGSLVIERETGAKYVYTDGKLYPALNFASARLALGGDTEVRTMSQKALQGVPRGLPVGIADAPDALPATSTLLRLPWQVCQAPEAGVSGRSTTRAVVGRELPGANKLGERALLVSSGETYYLLWHDTRMRVTSASVLAALGLSATSAPEVGPQLINAITAGPDLAPLRVAGAGQQSATLISGQPFPIGQVFRSAGQNYVLTNTALVPIGEVTARLALAGGDQAAELTADQVGAALSATTIEPEGMPATVPDLYGADAPAALCVAHRDASGRAPARTSVEVFDNVPADLQSTSLDAVPARQGARDTVSTVDQVVMTGGRAAVVRAIAGTGTSQNNTVYLVINGTRYPFGQSSGDARSALGYGGVTPLPVPAAMLTLVPTGPTLDVAAAKEFATPRSSAAPR
jgi:type VII secretion protein EccB